MSTTSVLTLMTAAEVAGVLGINVDTVYGLAASGRLPGCQIHGNGRGGRTWRFTEADLQTYLQSCRTSTPVATVADDGHARRRIRRKAS